MNNDNSGIQIPTDRQTATLTFTFAQLCELNAGLDSMIDLAECSIKNRENITFHKKALRDSKSAQKKIYAAMTDIQSRQKIRNG